MLNFIDELHELNILSDKEHRKSLLKEGRKAQEFEFTVKDPNSPFFGKSYDDEETEEDEYTAFDLLQDRLFGYGINKSNFRLKWKFADIEPSIKTVDGSIKKSYFYPTTHNDATKFDPTDRRAAIVDTEAIGVYVYDEDEASLAKQCADELKLKFELRKNGIYNSKNFPYTAIIYLTDDAEELPIEEYVEKIGKNMSDFLRKGSKQKERHDFQDHANYANKKENNKNECVENNINESVEYSDNDLETIRALYNDNYFDFTVDRNGDGYAECKPYEEDDVGYYFDLSEIAYDDYFRIFKDLIENCKFYGDGHNTYIQLHDHNTLSKIDCDNFEYDTYSLDVLDKARSFENKFSTSVYFLGRSGRHVCVDFDFWNLANYNEMVHESERLENDIIDYYNNMCNFKEGLKEGCLVEGPGAGYKISADVEINSVSNVEIEGYRHVDDDWWSGYEIEFTCKAKGTAYDIEAYSYGYGCNIDSANVEATSGKLYITESELNYIWLNDLKHDDDSDDYEEVIKEATNLLKNEYITTTSFKVDFVYGGGWSHSTYDGSIDMGEGDYVFDDLHFVNEKVISFIDRGVSGDLQEVTYDCFDDRDEVIESYTNIEDAKKAAMEDKSIVEIQETFLEETIDGDIDVVDTRVVWERDEFEECINNDSNNRLDEGKYRGSNNVEVKWNGAWADPDLIYNGYTFNYWDIENALWRNFLEETGHTDDEYIESGVEDEFNKYVKGCIEGYLDDCIFGGYFKKGSKSWHD